MAQQCDRTMKILTTTFAPDYLELALGDTAVYRGPLTLEDTDTDTDKELPPLARGEDFVARGSRQQEEALLLLEFQTCWRADMPQRMAGYTWRRYERYQLPVYPVVVVLLPGGALTREWRLVTWGREIAHCAFTVVAVREIEASAVIAAQRTGLYPLLPLMRWAERAPQAILAQSQELIKRQVAARKARADP